MNRKTCVRNALLNATACVALALAACASPTRSAEAPRDPNPGFLRQYAETNRFRNGRVNAVTITPDGSKVLFLRSGPRDRVQNLYEWDVANRVERVLLTADRLLGSAEETLTPEEKARRERARQTARGIASFELSKDGTRLLVPISGRLFVVALADGAITEIRPQAKDAPAPLDARFSPDASKVAFVRAGELWVTEIDSGAEQRLSPPAAPDLSHGDAEFVAQEEMGRSRGYWWSPDSAALVYQTTDTSKVESVYISDPLNPFVPAQSWKYPRAGTTNATVTLSAVAVPGGTPVPLEWDREMFPYLTGVKWDKQRSLFVTVQNRLQTEVRVLRFDPGTGRSTLLLSETDPAWVNLDQQMPHVSDDLPGYFWTTEGAGWTDLEWRMDPGNDRRLVVGGEINYRTLVKVDPRRRETLVVAGQDPTQAHLYSVEYREGDMVPTCLTCAWPGVHGATVSKDGSTLVLTTQPERGGVTTRVFQRAPGERGLGTPAGEIASAAERPPVEPRIEWTTVKGEAEWHAAVVRPSWFTPGRKLPVLCSVYTGPTAQTVQRFADRSSLEQWLADQGFIVVLIDNRGTPGRGRAWERLTHRNLIDLQLNDQTAVLRLLGERYPEMDMSHVGVYGWSFGGYYAAMAACRRPDAYKAACAGAPVTDWADYDTHYTERYMGLPNENTDGYRIGNVITWVKDLKSPLLLIHGSADDNVYFTHSLKLMEAALRQGVSEHIEFLPLAGQTHVVVEPEVVERMYTRMARFFQERLAAITPAP